MKGQYEYLGIHNSFSPETSLSRSSCGTLYADMRVEELKLTPVWLSSQHLLSTAKYVMDGHKLRAMGIVDQDRFVGILRYERLAEGLETDVVGRAMEEPGVVVQSTLRIEQAAELFVDNDIEYAPVVDGDTYLGLLTSNILLRELRQSRDPLSGLPWSDRLREWGIDRLREGHEITIVFMDLDDFGTYNKRFGHIVGDRVLKHFAGYLKQFVDLERDVLVRYGGDEFAIGTTRTQRDVKILLKDIGSSIPDQESMNYSDPARFTTGVSGGRRTIERENLHYAATLDNLINLASKDCQRNKRPKNIAVINAHEFIEQAQPAVQSNNEPATEPHISVVSVHDSKKDSGSLLTVILSTGDAVYSGVHTRTNQNVHVSIASATCQALQRIYRECEMSIDDVYHEEKQDGERYVTITGHLKCNGTEFAVSGAQVVDDDVSIAVARATVEAFNHSQTPIV
jgi:diguanylate cyclase (GGDEF)-like protein